jgi:tetratricopeptide (TPR) repeat protein
MGLVLEQLRIQNRILEGILDQLDAIHETLKHPLLTQARELSKIGMDRASKGLLQEGLEALLESAEKNRTDFLVQLQIGKLYLYGQNATDNVIDLPKAEEHLRLASRYSNSEISHLPDAAKYCAEAFLHAAIACYAQANEKWLAKDVDSVRCFTEQALELSKQATQVYPQLAEAFYHHSKCAALLGDGETAVNSLKTAILTDRKYCLKADADRDFDGVRDNVRTLEESLYNEAKEKANNAYQSSYQSYRQNLNQILSDLPSDTRKEGEMICKQIEFLIAADTYFDYLDALSEIRQAENKLPEFQKALDAKTKASDSLEQIKKLLEGSVFQGTAAQKAEVEIRNSVNGAESLFRKDTYFDYLDALTLLQKASQTFADFPRPFAEFQTLTGHTSPVNAVAFSPDGRYLASGSRDKTVRVYEVGGFREIQTLTGHTEDVTAVAFSPDGRYLASGSYDKTVRVFEVGSFREIRTLTEHVLVKAVAFSPDGRYLTSAEYKTVRVYEVGSFREIQTLGHTGFVNAVAFSPDGRYLAGGGHEYDSDKKEFYDCTVRVWGTEGIISRQEFEEQERRRIEAEKEAERRRAEEEAARRKAAEEAERERQARELREYRLRNGLCLECGEKLGFLDKLSGAQYCKRHRA